MQLDAEANRLGSAERFTAVAIATAITAIATPWSRMPHKPLAVSAQHRLLVLRVQLVTLALSLSLVVTDAVKA